MATVAIHHNKDKRPWLIAACDHVFSMSAKGEGLPNGIRSTRWRGDLIGAERIEWERSEFRLRSNEAPQATAETLPLRLLSEHRRINGDALVEWAKLRMHAIYGANL